MSEMKGTATILVQAPSSLKEQDVVPAKDRSFQAEKSLVMQGFPKVPKYWVSGTSVLSSTGGRTSGRANPTDVDMESHTRFIAHTFDTLGGTWRPFVTHGANYLMISPPGLAPHIEEEEYRLGKEILRRPSLWFNPGDYLVTSFNNNMDDARSFTIAMAITPRTPSGYTLISTSDDEQELSVQVVTNGFRIQYGSVGTVVTPAIPLANVTPVFVVLVCGASSASLYVGTKSSNLRSKQITIPSNHVRKLRFTLGKDYKSKAVSSFSLYDFVLYDGAKTHNEVPQVVALLSSTYGAL